MPPCPGLRARVWGLGPDDAGRGLGSRPPRPPTTRPRFTQQFLASARLPHACLSPSQGRASGRLRSVPWRGRAPPWARCPRRAAVGVADPWFSIARVPACNRKCFARVGFEGSSWYPVLCFENGLMIFVFLGNAFRLSRDGI